MTLKGKINQLEKLADLNVEDSSATLAMAPVDPATFIESPNYMDGKGELYPVLFDEFVEINSGRYSETVLTGGIGCGKTTLALFTMAYQLYRLSCLEDPHGTFSLSASSEIVIIFQSITADLAENVDFRRFKELIDQAPYFQNQFCYVKALHNELVFPNNNVVRAVSGLPTAAIGQNVFGGVLDEVNFMATIDKSRLSVDGKPYDQAWASYNALNRRRKSRFMKNGTLPGMFCLVSSKRYPGQFTDVKAEEAEKEKAEGKMPSIYVFDKPVWAVKPEGTFSGEWFSIFVGTMTRQPFIVKEGTLLTEEDQSQVIQVPVEFKAEFEGDIISALQDMAGVSSMGRHPFFVNREAVAASFDTAESVLNLDSCDFATSQIIIIRKKFREIQLPRFAHVDLALSNDSAGVACGYVERFVRMDRGEGVFEDMPLIVFDYVLEVPPPKGGEINFEKIRSLFYKTRDLGLPLKWISMDSYQSKDMEQILRQKGFTTGQQSMDKTTLPYDMAKSAFADGRVRLPEHPKALKELVQLVRDPKTGKIDHPPAGSKDLADAIAGVIFGLTRRREIWVRYGAKVSPMLMAQLEAQSDTYPADIE